MINLHSLYELRLLIMTRSGLLDNSYTDPHETTSIFSGHFVFPFLEVCSIITLHLNEQIGFSLQGMCFIRPTKKQNSCRWVSLNSQRECLTSKPLCEQKSSQITRTLTYLLNQNDVEAFKCFI